MNDVYYDPKQVLKASTTEILGKSDILFVCRASGPSILSNASLFLGISSFLVQQMHWKSNCKQGCGIVEDRFSLKLLHIYHTWGSCIALFCIRKKERERAKHRVRCAMCLSIIVGRDKPYYPFCVSFHPPTRTSHIRIRILTTDN